MIKFRSNCHWYTKGAEAQHDATLREARKQFLYPSVTTVDKDVFKNDFLDRWKMNELVAAAADNFKQPHETNEDYANRLYELSLEKATTASVFGEELHKAIEDFPNPPKNPHMQPWMDRFGTWYNAHVESPLFQEKVLLDHDLGVAGRCDFIGIGKGPLEGRLTVQDWKSQNVKKNPKGKKVPAWYESWPRQLAFYAVSFAKEKGIFPHEIPTCVSVVVDSNEPDDPFMKIWTKEEILKSYQDFVTGAFLWFSKRDYWPCGRWSPAFPFQMPN